MKPQAYRVSTTAGAVIPWVTASSGVPAINYTGTCPWPSAGFYSINGVIYEIETAFPTYYWTVPAGAWTVLNQRLNFDAVPADNTLLNGRLSKGPRPYPEYWYTSTGDFFLTIYHVSGGPLDHPTER